MLEQQVAAVRRFNRLVTQRVGALDDHYLGRGRALGASRLLYEVAAGGGDLRALRLRLGLDAGYASRLAKVLARQGLVRVGRNRADRRARELRLTAAGRREVRELNALSDQRAAELLLRLKPRQRGALVAAMSEVHRLLRAAGLVIERTHPGSPEARFCIARYFAELDRRFESGFDPGAALRVDERDLVPPHGAFLVGSLDGEPVACGCLKTMGKRVGYLKRMWVSGSVRGLGVGRRLLGALEQEARELGFRTLRLETNRALREAIALYRSSGYREVAAFNDEPYAHHWFEKRLARGKPGRLRLGVLE